MSRVRRTLGGLFGRRIRGVRVVNLASLGCLTALVLGVYVCKTMAGREGAEIIDVDHQIVEEQRAVRLLRAEVAHLEQPRRIERLSTAYLGLQPVSAKREAQPDALTEIARQGGAVATAGQGGVASVVGGAR